MKEIWFIRHGESMGNSGLPTPGVVENPLTEKGRLQAVGAAERINRPPDLIVLSPYLRAQQTAEPTRQRFPQVPVETWQVQEYTLLDAARYVGTTEIERERWAEAVVERYDPHYTDGEGADSFSGLLERIHRMKSACEASPHDFVTIFSHGRFIRLLLWYLLQGEPEATAEQMREAILFLRGMRLENGVIIRTLIDGAGQWTIGRL